MKILMLGNWSGMTSQIAEGLRQYGNNVTVAAYRDSFKGNYSLDINLSDRTTVSRRLDPIYNLGQLALSKSTYDVIHLQTSFMMTTNYFPLYIPILKKILSQAKTTSLSLAGDDYYFWHDSRRSMKYGPWDEALADEYNHKLPFCATKLAKFVNDWVVNQMTVLIPAGYEFIHGYSSNPRTSAHIPFAFNVNSITPKFPIMGSDGVIRILYAESRPGFKGSKHILPALQSIKKSYPEKIQLTIVKQVPYTKFQDLLSTTDIFVDQANSHGWGMAAVEAMALGKVVLSGAEPEALTYFKIESCPIINIKPDSSQIYNTISALIDDPASLVLIGQESRAFAKAFHGFESTIPKYLSEWSKLIR